MGEAGERPSTVRDRLSPRIRELRSAGAEEYFTKPLDVPRFLSVFDRTPGVDSDEGADG